MKQKDSKPVKDLLNNPPQFPFKEANWEKLAKQLDQDNQQPASLWKSFAWIGWFLLPFLLLGGWSWYTIQKSNKEIAALTSQLQSKHTTLTSEETTIQKRIVYQYDTIYRTIIIEQELLKNNSAPKTAIAPIAQNSRSEQLLQSFIQKGIGQSFVQLPTKPIQRSSLGAIQQFLQEQLTTQTPALVYNEAAIRQPLTALETVAANFLDIPLRNTPLLHLLDLPLPKIQEPVNPLLFLQPTGFSLGAEGSLIKLLHVPITSTKGLSAGLVADVHFGNKWSLFLGAEYLQHSFELEEAADLAAYPMVSPDNQDVFSYLRVSSKYLQIPVGFKYRFNSLKSIRPYVGAGFIARRPLRKDLDYEYLGVMEEYYINRTYQANSFHINSFRGELGVELQVTNHWNVYFEGLYDGDFRKSSFDFEKIKYLNVRAGVLYNF